MGATETILLESRPYAMKFRNYKQKRSVCGRKDKEIGGLSKETGTQNTFIAEPIKGISGI